MTTFTRNCTHMHPRLSLLFERQDGGRLLVLLLGAAWQTRIDLT